MSNKAGGRHPASKKYAVDDGAATSSQAAASSKRKYGFIQMFRYASPVDVILMLLGLLFAGAQGTGVPLALYFFYSDIINALLAYSECFDTVRENMQLIAEAERNGTFDRLPKPLQEFRQSDRYEQVQNYESLHTDSDYSLFEDVGPKCGYYALVGLGMFVCGCIHISLWTIAGERQIHRIRQHLFRAMLSKDAGWFDARRAGALNNTLFDSVRKMEGGMTSKVSISVSWIAVALSAYIIAFVTNWLVTIVIMSLVPLLFIVGFVMIRVIRGYSKKQSDSYGKAGSIANEIVGNVRTVLAFNKQEYEVERYGDHLGDSQHMGTLKTVASGAAQGIAFLIINSMAGLAFWWGANDQVREAGGNVMQIIICMMIGTTSLSNAAPNFENIGAALGATDEVYMVIDEKSRIDNFSEEGDALQTINGEIAFENVAFSYPLRPDRVILKSLNLKVQRGQTVALVGPSGCGKSTTAQMLMRFYDSTAGKVTLDGVDVKRFNVRWLRQRIGVVSQEPVLFNTTIRENIRLGAVDQADVSDDIIINACKLSNAHKFISSLPDGYNTMVGERGAQLSGGQKQRIAIARALVSNPKILVLDEATSALDTQSEKVVQAALDNARVGRTTLVIAHRLSTIKNADLIAVIDGGVVAELGNHETLMEKNGLYHNLVQSQEVERAKEEKLESQDGETKAEVNEIEEGLDGEKTGRSSARRREKAQVESMKMTDGGKVVEVDAESGKTKTTTKPSGRLVLLRQVLTWGRPELRFTFFCAVVSALVAAVQPAFAVVISEFLASFCPGDDTEDKFTMLIGVVVGLGAIQAILLILQHYLFSVIGERLTARMRCLVLGKILRMDARWLDRQENQPSVLTTVLATDCLDIQGMSGVRISVVVTILVTVGIALIYSLVLEYRVALALMGLMPFMIITTIIYNKMILGTDQGDDNVNRDQSIIAMDSLQNMRTVMALAAEPFFLSRFVKAFEKVKATEIKKGFASGPLISFTMSAILWSGAISFAVGSHLMEEGESDFVSVIRVFILITFSGMAIGRSTTSAPPMDKAQDSAIKLMSILNERNQIDKEDPYTHESFAARELAANKSLASKSTGRIEFKNVAFSYPTRPKVKVLKDVSFTVEPGQRVALCGPSGGGKSTIMQLVQRLYDPSKGDVLVDGVSLRKANIRAVRSNIGLVAQEPVLFALSIGENIAYGSKIAGKKPKAEEIDKACRQANAHEFLQRLPEGLETQVGERGAQLSGGQKQRIAIARALVRNPTTLLLDEATSALDTQSERVVQEALDAASQGRTSLTIAHRLSTIQNSDKILVLANGYVAEQGTHDELMEQQGIYFDLQQAQNRKAAGEP